MALAFAISIAAHEVVAGFVPRMPGTQTPGYEVVSRAQIARVAIRPAPTARPRTQRAAVKTNVMHLVPHRHVRTIGRAMEGRAGGRTGRPARRVALAAQYGSKPVWDVPGSGSGTAQLATAANGSGNGQGSQGNGNDAASATEPCGFVTFSDPHGSQYDARTRGFNVDIRMSVHFADGSSQSLILDYPWYYASEAVNPWSAQNLRESDFPTRFQPPPPGKIDEEPALVRYVADHSTADGMTLLKDCPTSAPST
jgi:hypothetical protein